MLRQLLPRCCAFKPRPASRLIVIWESSKSYSIQAESASTVKLQDIDPSKLSITKTTTPKELVPREELVFGRTFTGMKDLQETKVIANIY
jgi:branched-chain amino acid aminotransferase